jgi:hypothetical protein
MHYRWSGSVSLLIGVLLLIASGFLFFSGLGFADLKCVACDCRYDLSIPGCRSPIIYLWMATFAFVGSVGLLANRWLRRRQNKHIS